MFTFFFKHSDVNHSQISDPLYGETKKNIIAPIKWGWVMTAIKDYLTEALKEQ